MTVRKSLFWSFAERYLGLLIYIGTTMVLARLLSPDQIGIYSLCASFTTLAHILRDFGVSEYLIQEKHLTEDKTRSAYTVAIISAWSIGLCLLISRHWIADFYHEQALVNVLGVLCLNFLILPFSSPAFALMHRDMQFRQLFYAQTANNIVHATTSIVLAWKGYGAISLAWASFFSILIQSLFVAKMRPADTFITPKLGQIKGVFSYGMLFSSTRIIESSAKNAHEFIIGRQFGFAALGLFSRSFSLIEMFWTNVTSTIGRVATPAFANAHRQGANLFDVYSKTVSIVTCIAWPFYLFIALNAHDIIFVLFGSQWQDSVPLARALATFATLSALNSLALNLLTAIGQLKRRLHITLITAPVHILAVLIASTMSLQAITYAWLCTWLITLFIYEYHLRSALSFNVFNLWQASRLSLLIASLGVAAQYCVRMLLNAAEAPSLIRLCVVGLFAVITWLALVIRLRHPLHAEIQNAWDHLPENIRAIIPRP